MSRRKTLLQNSLYQDVEPPEEGQQIVRALGSRGGNIIEVETADGGSTLCIMPAKFHKKLWVKRGGYLIIDSSADAAADANSRITGTIVAVLYDEHVKQLKKVPGVWPPAFANTPSSAAAEPAAACAADPATHSRSSSPQLEEQLGSLALSSTEQEPSEAAGSQRTAAAAATAAAQQPAPLNGAAAAAAAAAGQDKEEEEGEEEDSEDSLPPLAPNNNRTIIYHDVYSSDEDSDAEGPS